MRWAYTVLVALTIPLLIAVAFAAEDTGPLSVRNTVLTSTVRSIQSDSGDSRAVSPASPDVHRMKQLVQFYVSGKRFMGSVLVARGHEVLLDEAYGLANVERRVPNSPATKYQLGSLTKQFTAASILLLEERGKLNVNDAVKEYMSDAPPAWDRVTIFNLLTHTSGIPDFTSLPGWPSIERFSYTPQKLVALFRDRPLDFQPGEKYSYSNSGYVLLGYLIERISGERYAQFVKDNIFTPLGMRASGYESNPAAVLHRASGYSVSGSALVNASFVDTTFLFSAGGLYSTTEDLLRWETGLFGGKVLSAESLPKMTTPFKDDYAFGLFAVTLSGHKVIDHAGGTEGFSTALFYYPDDQLTIVVLANQNGEAPIQIATNLAAIVHAENVLLPSGTANSQ